MNNYSKLYWLTRLDSLHSICAWFIILSGFAIIFYCIIYVLNSSTEWGGEDDDDRKSFIKTYGRVKNICLWIFMALGLVTTFVPSKDEMILIYAGGKTMDFIQKDSILNKIPGQTTTAISEYLSKAIKEIKKENK